MSLTFGPEGAIDTLNGRVVVSYGGQLHYADDGALYDPNAGYANTFSNYTLGPVTYQDGYIVRGDYRMPGMAGQKQGGGQLEYRDSTGTWRPVGGGLNNYDPRQDSEAQGSNERLQFDWAFANAPAGADIRTMRQTAIDAGWTEPDRSQNDGTFGSFLEAAVPGILAVVGVGTLANAGMLGGSSGASLGSGISSGAGGVTGVTAGAGGATGVTGTVAGLSGGTLAPAATGGALIGSEGLIGSTGNAIADSALNNALQSGITSGVTGNDPLEGALRGAAGGLISSSGVLNDISAALTPSDAGQVATNAISRGVNAAGTAAVTGGDPITAGLTSGIGNYVGGTVAETGAPPVVAGAVGGGAAGATSAALNGGDIANGLITGAAGGGASGLASQLGASSGVASGIGSIVGGVVGSELADDQTAAGPTPVGTPAPTPTPFAGMTFADMLPPEFVDVTRTTDWGSNRLATAGRI